MTRNATSLIDDLAIGLIRIGVCWAVFENAATWGQALIDTGAYIGQAISTLSPYTLTPSGVLQAGLNLAGIVWQAKAAGTWISAIPQELEFFFISLVIIVCWTGAALIYFGALLEAAALVYGGPLIIAFTPLTWTADLLVRWALSVFAVAIKIAILLMTLAVGMAIAQLWIVALGDSASTFTTNLWNLMISAVESLVFVYLVMKLPALFTGLIGGSPAFGFGEAFLGTVMGAFGSGAAAGGETAAGAAARLAGNAATTAGKATVQAGKAGLSQLESFLLGFN
jgi:P-type conjugative transfer protein TrbL